MSESADKNQFKNWREALVWLFNQDSRYTYTVDADKSTAFKACCSYNLETRINFIIADRNYEQDMDLVRLEITNPNSPGLNQYWIDRFRVFDENSYEDSLAHGIDGLPFSEKNIASLFSDLQSGYKGTEKQFFQDQLIIATYLSIEDGCLGGIKSLDTWQFNWRPTGLKNQLKWFFSSEEDQEKLFLKQAKISHVKEVDLSTIFKGIHTRSKGVL